MNEPVPEAEDAHEREATVLESYLRALDAGEAPDREEVLARHPDLAAELSEALDGLDLVHHAGKRLTAEESAAAKDGAGVGPTLGDYRLLREVGRGGMAVVYEAEQISLGRRVALKVLPFAAVLEPKQLQRFKNEALAAAQLQHPNIVPVYGVGCERGVHYYAMQYVEGQSLDRAIRDLRAGTRSEGPRTPISSHSSHREKAYIRMAATLGRQAAEALDHAHHLGVVHRDVKPANLLIDQAGTLWVTDFGLARCFKDVGLTLTGELLGTVRYMSPEQAHVKPLPIDHRTDVYSLGATLYEMFTLEPAFPGEDHHAVIEDIACREPVSPRRLNPSLPRDLETVVLKAMSKDPSARYATAQEMAEDLGRYLDDEPVLARRPSVLARTARWGGRHRRVVAASCALLLLGLAALGAYGVRITEEQRRTRSALTLARDAVDRFLAEAGVETFECDGVLNRAVNPELLEAALTFYGPDRDDVPSLNKRVMILHALSRYDEALAALDRVLEMGPPDVPLLTRRGDLLRHLGRIPEAMASWERVITMAPDQEDADFDRGFALDSAGHVEDAIDAYRRAIRDNQRGASVAHHNLGKLLGKTGDREAEIRELREATRLVPSSPMAHLGLGNALLKGTDVEGAIDAFREAIRLQPDFAAAHLQLGFALLRSGERKSAMREFRAAVPLCRQEIDRRPQDADLRHGLGLALGEVGDLAGGTAAFRQAIAMGCSVQGILNNLGFALSRMGDAEGAIAAYRQALADPSVRAVELRALILQNLGKELLRQRQVKEAIERLREAIRLLPDLPGVYFDLGMALLESEGCSARVVRAFRKAIALDRNYGMAYNNLAIVLINRGDLAGALGAWREAFRLMPHEAQTHYVAACYLMKVAGSNGPDAATWRVRALEWLHGALLAYRAMPGQLRKDTFAQWRRNPDLASVRDRLEDLPPAEREDWRTLWSDVDAAQARAQQAN